MKTNLLSTSKNKRGFVILILLFSGLFANKAAAQAASTTNDTFIWKGTNSSEWAEPDNWTIIRRTATPGNNNYPGEIGTTDLVIVNKSDTPFPAKLKDGQAFDIARLQVTNTFGGEAGATFTIDEGATLYVGNITTQSNHVSLNGGNVVNNGTLYIRAFGVGISGFPVYGISCGNPAVLPAVPTQYGYSGTGSLTIEMPNANFGVSAAFAVLGNNNPVSNGANPPVFTTAPETTANATYKFVLNNPTITFNQRAPTVRPNIALPSIYAIRAGGGNNANKMIISGTGFTIDAIDELTAERKPGNGGLISIGGGTSLTIDDGTTLTLNSAITNYYAAIGGFAATTFPTNFTNKGTINIAGGSTRSGMAFSTGGPGTPAKPAPSPASVYNINNEGTLNINLNVETPGAAGFFIGNGGGDNANPDSVVNVTNSGTMTLKNTSTIVGAGSSIFTLNASQAPKLVFTNSGTMTLEGSTYNYGLKTTMNNSGILNSNNELRAFSAVNNNVGGSINFVKNAATAITRQVSFTVAGTATSGSIGSIFRDSNNNDYVIVEQKFSGETAITLRANTLSSVTVPPTGTLTRVSGGGSETIVYTAVSLPAINNALGNTTNSGTINTGAALNLNIINALSATAETSVLSPGGNATNGLMAFGEVTGDALSLMGTLKMQASGSTTAGIDFDAINFTGQSDIIDISQTTLDLTGIYTPTSKLTIDIITTNTTPSVEGAISGTFASVIAPKGWTVNITEGFGSKVQLVFDPALTTAQFAQAKFSYYPNPTKNQLNVTAAKTINKVELYNVLGQNVLTSIVNATQKQVDISTLKTGIYMMEVTIENTKQSFKIVKE
jgi:hypothetical protein